LDEEVDGVGDKRSGDITMAEVETLLEVFLGTQNCEKRLLAPPYLSVCLSAWNYSAPIGHIFMKFDI